MANGEETRMAEKAWIRVPEKRELPAGASSYWGFQCRVCNARLPIGDAAGKTATHAAAAAAQACPGKMLWVICPHCQAQDQLYRPDEIIVFPAGSPN